MLCVVGTRVAGRWSAPFDVLLVRKLATGATVRAAVLAQATSPGCKPVFQEATMTKYGPKASEKVEKTLHEMKEGKLKSGSGKKVTSRKQAIAIGLSEAREAGAKVPRRSAKAH